MRYSVNKFTPSQRKFIDEFSLFMKDDKQLFFKLVGAAGTGKTFVLNYVLNNIVRYGYCISAPTHKALRHIEKVTGAKGKTIHSLHGLKPNLSLEKLDLNKLKFQSYGEVYFNSYRLIVIDEASMINKELEKLNVQRAEQFSTKILYVGDKCQLPPVGDKDMESSVFKTRGVELIEIVRQEKGNPLLELLAISRKDVIYKDFKILKYLHKKAYSFNEKKEGYGIVTESKFKELMFKYFSSEEFHNDVNSYRFAGYTNDIINKYNIEIRNKVNPNDELLAKGDLLMGYKTISDEFGSPTIINSEDYQVLTVIPRVTEDGFKSFIIKLQQLSDADKVFTVSVVDHTDESFIIYKKLIKRYINDVFSAKSYNRGKMWQKYFAFKERHLTMVDFEVIDDFFEDTHTIAKELDYGYGVTIHKLQGSTIKTVFVECADLFFYESKVSRPRIKLDSDGDVVSHPMTLNLVNKLFYTVLSRASKNVILKFF